MAHPLCQMQRRRLRHCFSLAVGVAAELVYNIKVVIVLSYPCQFYMLLALALRAESRILGNVLRLPGNALSGADIICVKFWGGYDLKSILALSLASLMRPSFCILNTWQFTHRVLRAAALEFKSMATVFEGPCLTFLPPWWGTLAMVSVLHSARFGFEQHPEQRVHGLAGLHALHDALLNL